MVELSVVELSVVELSPPRLPEKREFHLPVKRDLPAVLEAAGVETTGVETTGVETTGGEVTAVPVVLSESLPPSVGTADPDPSILE